MRKCVKHELHANLAVEFIVLYPPYLAVQAVSVDKTGVNGFIVTDAYCTLEAVVGVVNLSAVAIFDMCEQFVSGWGVVVFAQYLASY